MPPATYRYIAPEMLSPAFRDTIDYRSDLYTAALTIFEFAAGEHPLAKNRDDFIQTISRAIRDTPQHLKTKRPEFSEELCDTIDQLLKKRPALRPNLSALLKQFGGIK
jgi:serine/threonine protein kinase